MEQTGQTGRYGGISMPATVLVGIVLLLGLLVIGGVLLQESASGSKGVMNSILGLQDVIPGMSSGQNGDGGDGGNGGDGGDGGNGGDGGDTDPIEASWLLRAINAEVSRNTDSDLSSASDPKAKITINGETESTSVDWDGAPEPSWSESLFRRTGTEMTSLTVQIVDYDHSGSDGMGECSFEIAEDNFATGTTFDVTKSCDPFDITLGFQPRNMPGG